MGGEEGAEIFEGGGGGEAVVRVGGGGHFLLFIDGRSKGEKRPVAGLLRKRLFLPIVGMLSSLS